MRCSVLFIFCMLAGLPLTVQASFFDDDTPNSCISAAAATLQPEFSSTSKPLSGTVVKTIASAKKSIRMAARAFTSKPVSEALIAAQRAGVDVKIVLNKKDTKHIDSAAKFLMTMSYVPHVTKKDDALYANYIVIDERDIILGDIAGFVDPDEEKINSASILLIRNSPDVAKRYLDNWQSLWNASEDMPREKN